MDNERLELYGPWFANIKGGKVCKKCLRAYVDDDEEADEFGTGYCYYCFEVEVERAEERRRERIARENEY